MMARWQLWVVLLAGCGTSGEAPRGEGPSAESRTDAAPPGVPADALLYEFVVRTSEGHINGSRVWANGRVQVARADGEDPTWVDDIRMPPESLAALVAALASPQIDTIPDLLPNDPSATADAPSAHWRIYVGGRMRTITSERYAGIRVPALEALHRVLRASRPGDPLSTQWSIHRPDHVITATVPCQPASTRQLRFVVSTLLDAKAEPAPLIKAGEKLRIDWSEGDTRWSTVLTDDHRVLRIRPDGRTEAFKITPELELRVDQAVASIEWPAASDFCLPR